jgi:branched-chain amino acid transport system substrate-binding protein
MKTGVETALTEINAQGGLNGEKLVAVIEDDACDTKRAVEAAKRFLALDVRVVIGHFCSGASAAAAVLYQEAGILMLTPAASHPSLTEAGLWNVFRLTGRDDAQGRLAAERVTRETPAAADAIILDGSAASEALATQYALIRPGVPRLLVKSDSASATSVVAEVLQRGFSSLYLATGTGEATRLVAQLRANTYGGRVLGPDSLITGVFAERAGDTQFEVLATFPDDPMASPFAQGIVQSLANNNVVAEGATLPSHAAVTVFLAAAKSTNVNDGRAMARWLVAAPRTDTVLGPISFTSKGDLKDQPFSWYRWVNGAFAPDDR